MHNSKKHIKLLTFGVKKLEYEIKYRPSYSLLVVKLEPGEKIVAEQLKQTLQSTMQGSLNHPAIKKVDITIEP